MPYVFDPPRPIRVVVLITHQWTDVNGDIMARDIDGVLWRNPAETGSEWTRDR